MFPIHSLTPQQARVFALAAGFNRCDQLWILFIQLTTETAYFLSIFMFPKRFTDLCKSIISASIPYVGYDTKGLAHLLLLYYSYKKI